jgi:CRISPR-associated protein Csx3
VLLPAVPDGEGDWFQEMSDADLRFRLRNKGEFTPELVRDMGRAIRERRLPILVDIGGKPRGDQFSLMDACTHVIHLWRDETDRDEWRAWLAERTLIPVAELHSVLDGRDEVESENGVLCGTISGLDREHPHTGLLFERLAARVQGIFDYPAEAFAKQHQALAPDGAHFITVGELERTLGVSPELGPLRWRPEDLRGLAAALPAGEPVALYGRGPVWLYAAVAIQIAPATCYLFDARYYGWVRPPQIHLDSLTPDPQLDIRVDETDAYTRVRLHPKPAVLALNPVYLPPLPANKGVVLDGKLPNWLWAGLARALVRHPWIAVYEPRNNRAVKVWGGVGEVVVMARTQE